MQTKYLSFYVHMTMHCNKFLYNKTNQMHQFPKFTPAWNSTRFGQRNCPKHVEFHAGVNLGNWLIWLVFIINKFVPLHDHVSRCTVTCHDARSHERKIVLCVWSGRNSGTALRPLKNDFYHLELGLKCEIFVSLSVKLCDFDVNMDLGLSRSRCKTVIDCGTHSC